MKTRPLNDRFPDGAMCIEPIAEARGVDELSREFVAPLFERHGALLFRGFDLSPEQIVGFTDRFTEEYRRDGERTQEQYRRPLRFGETVLANVTMGNMAIELHSEAAHGVVWPEIIWFYCNVPSTKGAFTTLCDGVSFWRALQQPTRIKFLSKPLKYEIELPLPRRVPGGPTIPWPFESPGVSGFIDRDQGVARLSILRYAVNETRVSGQLAFANYLLHGSVDQDIKSVRMADDSPIEDATLRELQTIAEQLTYDVQWQPRDLLMVDNRRFMHGRREIQSDDPRDILQVQTVRSSFGFGSTTRKTTSSKAPSTG